MATRTVRISGIKPAEPSVADDAGERNAADDPQVVREDVKNTSTSSGLPADDEAAGEQTKELLRRGGQEVTKMD